MIVGIQGHGTHINKRNFDFCKALNDLQLELFRKPENAYKRKSPIATPTITHFGDEGKLQSFLFLRKSKIDVPCS